MDGSKGLTEFRGVALRMRESRYTSRPERVWSMHLLIDWHSQLSTLDNEGMEKRLVVVHLKQGGRLSALLAQPATEWVENGATWDCHGVEFTTGR